MSSKRFTAEQWRVWFEEFERAGVTVRKFCDSKRTTNNTFYKWRRRLRAETPALGNANSQAGGNANSSAQRNNGSRAAGKEEMRTHKL